MAVNRKNKKQNKIKLLIVIFLIILLLFMVVLYKGQKAPKTQQEIAKIDEKVQEERKNEIRKELYNKTEQERMQFYCGDFFKLIDTKNYEKAYELLYSEYKENLFPTFNNFKKYFETYFPSDFAISYNNIERLGDIYVLNVNIQDTVNGSLGHNFSMYVVLKENSLDNYVLSFSRNSAVGEEE